MEEPPFEELRSACFYEGCIAEAIKGFKFYGRLSCLYPLVGLLDECYRWHFQDKDIHLVVPVPLHRKRLISRGFNQSALLAGWLSKRLQLACGKNVLVRVKNTVPQVKLSGKERRRNLRRAFALSDKGLVAVKDRNVLVVDDVVTTGTTIREVARVLGEAGARKVYGVSIARAL